MPFENEHSCRLEDPDDYDEFRRDTAAAEVAGREVDHIYGTRDPGVADLQAIRFPLDNGWDTDAALLDAQSHCEDQGGLEFEPAEGFTEEAACLSCGDNRDHDMTDTTKHTTVTADAVVERELRDDEEREVLRVPISSTRTDREGDRFSKAALEDMAEQIREHQPLVFDDHGRAGGGLMGAGYSARETIGTQFDAELEQVKDEDDEHELFAFINPDLSHEEGERMLKQVRDELQAVKFSVGFRILDHDPIEDGDGNEIGREFTAADLMETSRVGIPANPDASVTTAAAKDGMPGYPMHPAWLNRAGLPEYDELEMVPQAGFAAKGAGDLVAAELREEIDALREEVADLQAALVPEGDESSAIVVEDTEGVTVSGIHVGDPDGEATDEEVADAVPDETDDTDADDEADTEDKVAELEAKIEELREAVGDGPGDSETGDPTTADAAELVDETDEDEAEETRDADDSGTDHEYATSR